MNIPTDKERERNAKAAEMQWQHVFALHPADQPRCLSCKWLHNVSPERTTYAESYAAPPVVSHPKGWCYRMPKPIQKEGWQFCGEHTPKEDR